MATMIDWANGHMDEVRASRVHYDAASAPGENDAS